MNINKFLKCNFCDLFGFNDQGFPVSRMPIKIDKTIVPEDYVITPDSKIGGFYISRHIDDYALVYYDDDSIINLHMFTPDDCSNKALSNCKSEKRLYKYGRKIHLNEAFEEGIFKIFPASTYLKIEDDEARHDNEFVTTSVADGAKYTASFIDKTDGKLKSFKPIGNVSNHYIMTANYYMLCLSYAYDTNLYNIFKNSDSCLIIKDPSEFSKRMHAAFDGQYPGYYGIDARVCYGNQLSPLGSLFTKDKKYLIQREYRFVWMPNHCKKRLDPIRLQNNDKNYCATLTEKPLDLCVGNFGDIAELSDK